MMKLLMLLALGIALMAGCQKGAKEETGTTGATTSTAGTRGIDYSSTRGIGDENTSKPALQIDSTKEKTK